MTEDTPQDSTGQRIARARKRRALTQTGLADAVGYARSHIAQVERGHKVATPSFIAAAAAALRVDPAELTGQPYRGRTADDDRVHATIDEVRRALATVDVPLDLGAPPRSLEVLAHEIEVLRALSMAASHLQVGTRLPAVIDELAVHIAESDAPHAWTLLNAAQALAVSLARRLGYNDLAASGIKDAAAAAAHSDDPNLTRLAALSRALLMMTMGAWAQGLALVRRVGDGMDTDTPDSRAVYGALQLRAAVLSARAGDENTAWEHFGCAEETAAHQAPNTPDFYAMQFNRPNVALHGAAVAVELRDFDEALRRDAALDLVGAGLPPERRAHHEVDMARALAETARHGDALARLLRAERIAPQMTRHHPSARAVVRHLVDVRRALPEPLRQIQSRMNV